jgi:hypothetical protein
MLIIKIVGKAQTVFAILELAAEKAGRLTIAEIIKLKERRLT